LSKINIDSDYIIRCKAISENEELDFEIVFLTLVETLKNFPLFEDPWGSHNSVARRVIAKYSNGLIFSIPIDRSPNLTNLIIEKLNGDPQIEFEKWKSKLSNNNDWKWSWGSFGWRIELFDNDTIIKILQELKSIYGEPRIVLPWMSFVEQYLDDPEDFNETFVEDDENLQAGAELIASFEDLDSELIEICEGDENLSENSAYIRFFKMLQTLESEYNWIVLDNECCGSCAGGSIRQIQESNPEKLNSSTFVVWEQSASDSFFADGDLEITHYLGENINEITELELAASKFGFKVEQDLDNKDENNKSVSISDSNDLSKMLNVLAENQINSITNEFNEIMSAPIEEIENSNLRINEIMSAALKDIADLNLNIDDVMSAAEKEVESSNLKIDEIISIAIKEIENSNLRKAEELLVDAHEKSRNASDIDSSALMIIEKILIPQSRLIETEMWTRSIVNTNKRQELRNKLKEIGPLVAIKRVTEQSDWENSNISKAIQKSSDQQYFYNRFVKYLSAQEPETLNRDTMSTWPGPGFYGFLSGFFEGNKIIFQMGCERETIALAIFDFYNFVMDDPLGSEERNPGISDAPYQNYSEEQILKLCEEDDPWALKQYGLLLDKRGEGDLAIKQWEKAAKLGNHTSMRNLGSTAFKNGKNREAISYLQNAIAAGSKTSHHGLAIIYEITNPELVEKTLLEGLKLLDIAAINRLGTLKQKENKWDEAIYYYRKAAEYGDFVAMANLANVLFQKEPEQSLVWLIRAEDRNPIESKTLVSHLQQKFYRLRMRNRTGHSMTTFERKVAILAELWTDYSDDKNMADFFEYNDLGLPLAFMLEQKIVESTPVAQVYIEETFELFCELLGLDSDEEYENLNGMFDLQEFDLQTENEEQESKEMIKYADNPLNLNLLSSYSGEQLANLSNEHPSNYHVYQCETCQNFEPNFLPIMIVSMENVFPETQLKMLKEAYSTSEGDLSKGVVMGIISNSRTKSEVIDEIMEYFPVWAFEDLKNHPNITQKALTEINEEL